ncbi:MAG TPA: M10 family metallopeptidase C-terminal domain-containing protein, partial [Caulobacteraceae bacterium]
RITGNSAANLLVGGDGNDRLNGAGGADTMRGGLGNDLYYVDELGDVVTEYRDEGTDTVISTITYGILSAYENITLAGSANIDATGNNSANMLTGNDADNVLTGLRGADRMWGKAGSDTFLFKAAADSITGQEDRIYDFDALADVIDLSLIDANTALAGNQAFAWAASFSGQAGQAVLGYNATSNLSTLSLDANGDGVADFKLLIDGHMSGDSGFIL